MDWNWSLGGSASGGSTTTASSGSGSGLDVLNKLITGQQNSTVTSSASTPGTSAPPPAPRPGATTATGVQTLSTPPVATGNPGNNPYNPPNGTDHWQNGQANPNGTQNANGQQTGGRYVDPTYQTDATGRQLSPEEQAYWRQYDTNRAQAASIQRSNNVGGSSAGVNGQKIIYNDRAHTWSLYDPTAKSWSDGIATKDIYGKLTGDLKNANPEWYYGQSASSADDARTYELNRQTGQYAQQMGGTNQLTRFPTYGI